MNVLAMVVGQGLRLVVAGLAVGLCAAALLSGSISAMLFLVTPRDVTVFALVTVVLFVAGALASWIPARRATRVDPVVALRGDA